MIYCSLPGQEGERVCVDISLPSEAMNAAEITLTGRYPEKGFALNQDSDMVVRILKGSVTFQCEGEEVELPEGSTVLVQKGKKYCWAPQGSATLYIVSSPPWTPEQSQNIPE